MTQSPSAPQADPAQTPGAELPGPPRAGGVPASQGSTPTAAPSGPHRHLAEAESARDALLALRAELAKAVVGQEGVVSGLVIALLCRGHVLLEGVPGVAKTLLVRALAAALQLEFKRVQFTPDLMPGDVTGWLETFGHNFITSFSAEEKRAFIEEVCRTLEPQLVNSEGDKPLR